MAHIIGDALTSIYRAGNSAYHNRALEPEELAERSEKKRFLELVKVAAVISALVSITFFAALPSIFSLTSALISCFFSYEIHKTADNCLEFFNHAITELSSNLSKEAFIGQITKNTILVGPLIRSIDLRLRSFS